MKFVTEEGQDGSGWGRPSPILPAPIPGPPYPHPALLEFPLCLEILWLSETMLVLLFVKENQLQVLNLFLQETVF